MKTAATSTSCLLVIKPNAACCRGARLSGCVFYCTTKPARRLHLPCVCLLHCIQSKEEGGRKGFFFLCCCEISEGTSPDWRLSWAAASSDLLQFQAELHHVGMQRRFTPEFHSSMLRHASAANDIFSRSVSRFVLHTDSRCTCSVCLTHFGRKRGRT